MNEADLHVSEKLVPSQNIRCTVFLIPGKDKYFHKSEIIEELLPKIVDVYSP